MAGIKKRPSLRDLFDILDVDKDGAISKEEVVLNAERLELTEKDAAELFDELDVDKSGSLSRQELKVWSWDYWKKKLPMSPAAKAAADPERSKFYANVEDQKKKDNEALTKPLRGGGLRFIGASHDQVRIPSAVWPWLSRCRL